MAKAEPLGVWFKNLDKDEKQMLVNDLQSNDFKKVAKNLAFANWNDDTQLNELQQHVSKWDKARQDNAQAQQGLIIEGMKHVVHDYVADDMKDLSDAITRVDDKVTKHGKKVKSLAHNSQAERDKLERNIKKFSSLYRIALDLVTLSSYVAVITAICIGLFENSDNGKSIFNFCCMFSSLLIFAFTKQFPDLTLDLCCCVGDSCGREDIWLFHRIRNTLFASISSIVSLTVDFGKMNGIASILCYCGALLSTIILAFFTLNNINDIRKLLKSLKAIQSGNCNVNIAQQLAGYGGSGTKISKVNT